MRGSGTVRHPGDVDKASETAAEVATSQRNHLDSGSTVPCSSDLKKEGEHDDDSLRLRSLAARPFRRSGP